MSISSRKQNGSSFNSTSNEKLHLLPHTPSTSSLISNSSSRSTTTLGYPFSPSRSPSSRYAHSAGQYRQSNTSLAASSITESYSLSADPSSWGATLHEREPDDVLHEPDRRLDYNGSKLTWRGIQNLGCLAFLLVALLGLFVGFPLASFLTRHLQSTQGGFNFGGINATGQVPSMSGGHGLIDLDTPQEFHTIPSYHDPSQQLELVFSDEFNVDGRSFYPGDDPYWEAVDLHYWSTGNLEWYDPSAITTKNGSLQITLSHTPGYHDLNYTSGMLSSWNKFCFTGGLVQVAVTLPGANNIMGLWPAVWMMGNLGRAGFGASLEGMWPYSYDACDVGTVYNQTVNGQPITATHNGDIYNGDALSYLPGQRLSRCTCPGESHPGPIHSTTGEYVGRAAPEIDVFEATIAELEDGSGRIGQVSQSAQWAPYNEQYAWFNTTDNYAITDPDQTVLNPYVGSVYQQATSGLSTSNQDCYELGTGCFSVYGVEYKPGYNDGYISWINNNKLAWTLNGAGMDVDNRVEINARPVSQEPMYLLMNLGMSPQFGTPIEFDKLTFPTTMSIDYIRVYQPAGQTNTGCDPEGFPTSAYINEYIAAYTNANLTTWKDDFGQPFPKNKFLGEC